MKLLHFPQSWSSQLPPSPPYNVQCTYRCRGKVKSRKYPDRQIQSKQIKNKPTTKETNKQTDGEADQSKLVFPTSVFRCRCHGKVKSRKTNKRQTKRKQTNNAMLDFLLIFFFCCCWQQGQEQGSTHTQPHFALFQG